MHIQIKTPVAPPEGVGGRLNGWTIHDNFRAKEHGDGWLYEPIARSEEGRIVFPIPGWLVVEDINICSHDEEILKHGVGIILCSDNGKALSPYFIPKVQRKEMPNALFSLPFPYVRITFDSRINYLHIERVEPTLEMVESSAYATVSRTTLFTGAVKVKSAYCKTCSTEFKPGEIFEHIWHQVTPSVFDVTNEVDKFDKAIRAVYKKTRLHGQTRPFFVYT